MSGSSTPSTKDKTSKLGDKSHLAKCPLERSVTSAGISLPRRRDVDSLGHASGSRPRANTGSRTPRTPGLGVPAEKVPTGRALERRPSKPCLATCSMEGEAVVRSSGSTTPSIVVTPALDSYFDEDALDRLQTDSITGSVASLVASAGSMSASIGSLEGSTSSSNSDLSALREDADSDSPPRTTLNSGSGKNVQYSSSSEDEAGPSNYQSILLQSRMRSRQNTMTSVKSVDFKGNEEVVTIPEQATSECQSKERLSIKAVQFDNLDPDPVFHRSSISPGLPTEEAHVEQVGAFRVANLRNDSLGNLPKIVTEETEDMENSDGSGNVTDGSVRSVKSNSGAGAKGKDLCRTTDGAETDTSPLSMTCSEFSDFSEASSSSLLGSDKSTLRQGSASIPSRRSAKFVVDEETLRCSSSLPDTLIPFAKLQQALSRNRKPIPPRFRNPVAGVLPTETMGTTAVCDFTTAPVLVSSRSFEGDWIMNNPFHPDAPITSSVGGLGEGFMPEQRRRRSSVACLGELLRPQGSRRSSAWAVGKGSLGIVMDRWGEAYPTSTQFLE
ncbi:hypothetical protein BZA77DRAFT_294370 [Pyronema omphalodes]|nr:hypothetical protein BZA77DRAFT_294370 [Pyronema omphalodes]